MRIIGGHDYYDGAVPFDTDRSRVFLRDNRELRLPMPKPVSFHVDAYTGAKWAHEIRAVEVLFCGRRYRAVHLWRYLRNGGAPPDRFYFWTAEKLRAFMVETGMSFAKRPTYRWRRENDKDVWDDTLEKFFATDPVAPALLKQLIDNGVLIAVAPESDRWSRSDVDPWKVNCDGLKDIHFSSVMPPWEAYQELDMFLGTVLVGDGDRMVKVSDATKLRKYGFDNWSFKNPAHRAKPRGRHE